MNPDDILRDESDDDDYDLEPLLDAPSDSPIISRARNGVESQDNEDDDEDEKPPARRPPTDDEISSRVRRLLRTDSATTMLRVHVSTEDGVVTLQGSVQTLDDTDNAAEVASRVDGVLDVIDELEVEL
jgi:osmotically-inducible protein OsmY